MVIAPSPVVFISRFFVSDISSPVVPCLPLSAHVRALPWFLPYKPARGTVVLRFPLSTISTPSLYTSMPSTLKRTQRKALTLTRSFTDAIKARINTAFFLNKRTPLSPSTIVNRPSRDIPQPSTNTIIQHPEHYNDPAAEISRPRPLLKARRVLAPTAFPYAHHPYRIHFIHQLPYELLAHIFVLGSEDDSMLPVQVSLVCRTWRQIALRTPALWRRITLGKAPRVREVVGPVITERQWESEWEMWTERIKRARACTLDIQLTGSGNHGHGYSHQRHPVDADVIAWRMHIVTPYISRWRSLSINFTSPAPYLWNAALSSCCGTTGSTFRSRRSGVAATSLEELTLVYRHNDDNKTFVLFSGSAPKLRRATLDGIRLSWLPSLFGNLTYLDWTHHAFSDGDNAADEVLSMLEVSSKLIELRLLFPEKRTEAPAVTRTRRSRTIALPHLRRMQLRIEGHDIPYELVKTVTQMVTPQLQHLHLVDVLRTPYFRSTSHYPPSTPYIHVQTDTPPFQSLKSFFYVYPLPHTLRELRVEGAWYDPGMIPALVGSSFRELRKIVISGRRGEQVLEVGAFSAASKNKPQKRPSSSKQRVGRQVGVTAGGSQGRMSMHMHVRQNNMWITGR